MKLLFEWCRNIVTIGLVGVVGLADKYLVCIERLEIAKIATEGISAVTRPAVYSRMIQRRSTKQSLV